MKLLLFVLLALASIRDRVAAATSLWLIAPNGAATQQTQFADFYRNNSTGQWWGLSSDGLAISGAYSRTITGVLPTVSLTSISAVFGDSMYAKADDGSLWLIAPNGVATQQAQFADFYRNDSNGQWWGLSSDGLAISGAYSRTITGVLPTVSLTSISAVFGDSMYAKAISVPETSTSLLLAIAAGGLVFVRQRQLLNSRTSRPS